MNRTPERTPRVRSFDDLRLLHAYLLPSDNPYARLALVQLLTGQRILDVAQLDWRRVDIDRAEWRVPGRRGRATVVPLSSTALSALLASSEGYPAAGPILAIGGAALDTQRAGRWLRRHVPPPLQDLRFSEVRLSVACCLRDAGITPAVVDEILGWGDRPPLDHRWLRRAVRDALEGWARALAQ